jgi:hypothetical protein
MFFAGAEELVELLVRSRSASQTNQRPQTLSKLQQRDKTNSRRWGISASKCLI